MRKNFGRSVLYAGEVKHGSYRTARNQAMPLNGRSYEHLGAREFAVNVVGDAPGVGQRNFYRIFKRLPEGLLNGRGRVRGLGRADAHLALSVADNQSSPETETASAGYHARYAPKVDHFLVKLRTHLIKPSLSEIISHKSKFKSSFPASFGHRFDAAVIFITSSVKNHFFYFGPAGFFREYQPKGFGPPCFCLALFAVFQNAV